MKLETINSVFREVVRRGEPDIALWPRDRGWAPISAADMYRFAGGVARELRRWGLQKGDRVAILSENRPEWHAADFGALMIGAVDVPLYPTLTPDQIAYILTDAGARVLFVSTPELLAKFQLVRSQTPVEHVVLMDEASAEGVESMQRIMMEGPTAPDAELDALADEAKAPELATIIYTSGTTGTPKGVMLTHGNMAAYVEIMADLGWHGKDLLVSFLPLSHIIARTVDYSCYHYGVQIAYCPKLEEFPLALREVRPTIFVGVPRVYEKIQSEVLQRVGKGWKKLVYDWAIDVGRRNMRAVLAGQTPKSPAWRLANRLFYKRVRDGLGGRVQALFSGGAPMGREVMEWFASVGLRVDEGYGLTESCSAVTLNTERAHCLGSVGRPLRGIEVRIAEDGEILLRGPLIFQGYWNLPEETKNTFVDGWFKTGDIGRLDENWFLHITDRKKDLIKTSGGKFVAPQPIENALKANALVSHAMVLGDRRKFASVIVVPHFPLLEDWARVHEIAAAGREELVRHPKVRALYEGIVDDVNSRLARFEQIKRVLVLPEEFSISNGTLTPTLKLKRRVVEERFRKELDAMYAENGEDPAAETGKRPKLAANQLATPPA